MGSHAPRLPTDLYKTDPRKTNFHKTDPRKTNFHKTDPNKKAPSK